MNPASCQVLLATTLASTSCSAPAGTVLERTGQSILRMADAYERDGRAFVLRGDPVNALAAFLYGLGWLHCGIAGGFLVAGGDRPGCPFGEPAGPVPPSQSAKLDEKTSRYARLLATALASVSPAPDPAAPAHAFARQVLFIAGLYLTRGTVVATAGQREEGLACFSYGHGWLDCGVEAGLFAIHANREIFTAG